MVVSIVIGLSLSSCSDSNSPEIKNIKGVWEGDSKNGYDLLITNDCWIASYGVPSSTLYGFKNSSFKECFNEFENRDVDFAIYRYDKKNDYFLIYWYSDTNSKGEPLFDTEPTVGKLVIDEDQLTYYYSWIDNTKDYGDIYNQELTYKEIMSNSNYGRLPKDAELDDFDYEVYYKYEP